MSKGQTLRALVNERLAAAVEDIFVLFERTIAEYEEELCRSREENQRKQQLLDKVLYPTIRLVRGNFQIPSTSPGPGLNQDVPETSGIKEEPEEQSVKQEEEQLPVCILESNGACVKTEESSPQNQSAPQTSVLSEDASRTEKAEPKFSERSSLMRHQAINTGEKRYSCNLCSKTFAQKSHLNCHRRTHTGEKPYSCSTCEKRFRDPSDLSRHKKVHTGLRPHICSVCNKAFVHKYNLNLHTRTHTGEKPYKCSVCGRTFAQHSGITKHKRTHDS